jgi:RNA polymerase sigma-70 factor, ECF subfamily
MFSEEPIGSTTPILLEGSSLRPPKVSCPEWPIESIGELALSAPANHDARNNVLEDAETQSQTAKIYAGWVELVWRIRTSGTDGMVELYHLFSKGIRSYLCRQLGVQDLDDRVHDTFVVVVQAIRRGELRQPERLMGFVRTIARRQVAAHIRKAIQTRPVQMDLAASARLADRHGDPEETAISHQQQALVQRLLAELSSRDREILTRFYLHEESEEEICSEMTLTETQFRLLKSRAKSRFGELGKKRLARRRP